MNDISFEKRLQLVQSIKFKLSQLGYVPKNSLLALEQLEAKGKITNEEFVQVLNDYPDLVTIF